MLPLSKIMSMITKQFVPEVVEQIRVGDVFSNEQLRSAIDIDLDEKGKRKMMQYYDFLYNQRVQKYVFDNIVRTKFTTLTDKVEFFDHPNYPDWIYNETILGYNIVELNKETRHFYMSDDHNNTIYVLAKAPYTMSIRDANYAVFNKGFTKGNLMFISGLTRFKK